MKYFNKLPIKQGINLIYKAIEQRDERKAWEMWLTKYQNMNKDNFIPFTEFYKKANTKVSQKPTEEILKESHEIRQKLKT